MWLDSQKGIANVDFFNRLFDTSDFPARWQCGRWSSGHGWLHILSDLGIWSAYVAIPLVLCFFLLQRSDLPFRKIFLLFGAFILACGTTHLMEAIIFWWPIYRVAGIIKLFTAIISWSTVCALIPIVPKVLAMRSPEDLEREIAARNEAEASLHRINFELEQRVDERTKELKHAVAALMQEQELLRTTLGSIGDGVIVTDAEGNINFLNMKAESLTEWKTAEVQGRPLQDVFRVFNEATQEPAENPVLRALQDGHVVELTKDSMLIGKNGTERAIDDSAGPIRDEHGQVVGCVLVFRDVSERRLLEKHKSQQLATAGLLASIVEYSEDAIIRTTLDGTIESWNLSAERLFGYATSEAIGRNISIIIPIDRADEEQQIVTQLQADEHVSHFDTVRLRQNGSRIDVALTVSAIRDANNQIVGISKTARDITGKKEAEDRIYSLMHELKEADRRKDEFLATLAHELRNPLAPIRNSLEVMKRVDGNSETMGLAQSTMERQLVQMVRLVDDLLDISRITRNKVELRIQRVELSSIIYHAIEMCQPLIDSSGHEVIVSLPEEPIYLNVDAVRIAQVVSNLLNNACKFSNRNGRIELTVQKQQDMVLVSVKDNGIGIPSEMLTKVFEMFTQLNSSLERVHGGLGIGLTLVHTLVEMHGGRVTAHSDGPEQGSEFVVFLPASKESPMPDLAPDKSGSTDNVKSRRILIVDDNKDSANSLAIFLNLAGNATTTAYDGEEAVEKANVYRPDMILLDLGLPKRNGYDACRLIRQQPWGRKILLIALTGWGQEEDRRKSHEAGFDGHLVKPVNFDALVKLMNDADNPDKTEERLSLKRHVDPRDAL